MTELQEKLLGIFSWYHDFCENNGLTYFALGGTALGAVRHNGFIPWDDDIDVGMPRKDYERFLDISKTIDKNSRYTVEFPSDKKDYVYPFAKVYDKETTLVENTRYKTKRGIYIDVFPIDGVGNTEKEATVYYKKVDRYIAFFHTRVCALRKGRKLYKNAAILISRCIPDFLFKPQNMLKKIDILSKRHSFENCKFVANFVGNWHEKEIMNKEWIGNLKLCNFEQLKMYILENYDAYLTHMYGDYMTPPPPHKQIHTEHLTYFTTGI